MSKETAINYQLEHANLCDLTIEMLASKDRTIHRQQAEIAKQTENYLNVCRMYDVAVKDAQALEVIIGNQRKELTRFNEQQAEIARLKKIEAMAMACDGIDMGDVYWIPAKAWEDLIAVVL